MSEKHRAFVESVIKKVGGEKLSSATKLTPEETEKIVKGLLELGFTTENAKFALQYNSNFIDALDWLCLNLAEDALPTAFDPRGKSLQVRKSVCVLRDFILRYPSIKACKRKTSSPIVRFANRGQSKLADSSEV